MKRNHDIFPDLSNEYREALREYLSGGGEVSLHKAYEIGRQALASGTGLLGLVNMHQAATAALAHAIPPDPAAIARMVHAAGHFLLEALSPFEMMQLGNQESTAALRRLNEILEEEAKRIAHILHDEAAQLLASVYLELAEIARETPPAPVQQRVDKITAHLDLVREQLRQLSHELRPPILDQLGLMPALQFLADGFRKRSGLDVSIKNATDNKGRLPAAMETALYRAVQEALNNVSRHAQAKHTEISVWNTKWTLYCAIKDDGKGFLPAPPGTDAAPRGLGLLGIQERVASLHGSLKIDSVPGAGTELLIAIPLGSNA